MAQNVVDDRRQKDAGLEFNKYTDNGEQRMELGR